jgi:hypothetical protein
MTAARRGTELDDLDKPFGPTTANFTFDRDARLFARNRSLLHELAQECRIVPLAPDQLYQAEVPLDAVVRRGKLRVSEFLPDGREVTRAVLQTGAVFRTRPAASAEATSPPAERERGSADSGPPASPPESAHSEPAIHYDLADIVLTSLGEAELWLLAAGTLTR